MDRLATLTLFVRIVDRAGFSAAAADLGVSRPVATAAIQALERRLGARLLHRTTRHVRATAEGQAYYEQCVRLLAELEEADRSVGGVVSGVVRVDAVGQLVRGLLLPALPDFLERHSGLVVQIGEGERFVDLVREGVDCVVRAGALPPSDLVARKVGELQEITVASPRYLARHGRPVTPVDLAGHCMVGFVSSRTGQPLPLEFIRDGEIMEVTLPARLLVTSADTSAEAARLGLGLVQAPRSRFEQDLARGVLVEVLADFRPIPTPLSVLVPSARQLAPRVRVFTQWLVDLLQRS